MSAVLSVLGICGSLRKGSYNGMLLREAQRLAPPDTSIEIADLSEIPLYNGDVEAQGLPSAVRALRVRVRAADALLFATPEYNYSIPGVLKNAIDWVSRPVDGELPFDGKPVALMGAGARLGTARAQYHLRQVCVYTNMLPVNKPEVMVANAWEQFDKDGGLRDEKTRQLVTQLLASLAAWTRRLRAA
ncbi:MAG TPA: NADPH-dependent FMN reductase [Myxococcota bacterium]|nr:NADPH-dependent FMN reductase [Myxococcota bacterium]